MMKKFAFVYKFIALLFAAIVTADCYAVDLNGKLIYPDLTRQVTEAHPTLWTVAGDQGTALRSAMYELVEGSTGKGLDKQRYHYSILKNQQAARQYTSPEEAAAVESYYTDALIAYSMDMTGIAGIDKWISYNKLSEDGQNDAEKLITGISSITDQHGLQTFAASLEPTTPEYNTLLAELQTQVSQGNKTNIQKLKTSLLFLRWIHHFGAGKYIVVNIPSATLRLRENGTDALQMKVVVGKPSTKTPRFASYCHEVILYPYWHVPNSIAVNEILPGAKKNSGTIRAMNLQVWTAQGKQVNPSSVNWSSYSKDNFPYRLRQESGCGNALGVVKFNLENPFAVYLHDTNFKGAFQNKKRYLSHGCIRVEKPMELANSLLPEPVDKNFLQSCHNDQESIVKSIDPVPVFVVYMPAVVEDGVVTYKEDVYKLL